ncbi:MAG: hypothetical protein HUU01_08910, partial [Saprospiraceae bacterium]|nr:hypothetical protein [Saprospiraceae bacterium]
MRKTIQTGLFFLLFIQTSVVWGDIKLPRLVSDGMVLQQGVSTNIWGWASPMEQVSVEFAGAGYRTEANQAGEWKIALKALPAGGPYKMILQGHNTLTIFNILIGEVWVCSGQSNMELPMKRVRPIFL